MMIHVSLQNPMNSESWNPPIPHFPAEFEEDVFWKHHNEHQLYPSKVPTSLKWGRIDLSRNAHKHPPKLHTYLEMKDQDPEEYKNRKINKFIAW